MTQRGKSEKPFIELQNSLMVIDICTRAIEKQCIVLIVGAPGLGKTMALQEFYRRRVTSSQEIVHFTVPPYVRKKALTDMLLKRFEIPVWGNASEQLERIRDYLARTPFPLIFDESNHLDVECLEGLRYLADQTGIPIVFCGSMRLYRTLSQAGDKYFELEQLQSRIYHVAILQPLTESEVKKCLRYNFTEVSEEMVSLFHKESGGITRNLFNIVDKVKEILKNNKIASPTAEMIAMASSKLMLAV